MYSLNYAMVVQVLQQFKYSGEVHAYVGSHTMMRDGGHVVLTVQRGMVVSCTIFDDRGRKLYQDTETYNVLLKLGVLDWELVPFVTPQRPPETLSRMTTPRITATPLVTPTPRMEDKRSFLPRRLPVSPVQMRTWPALHRSVYALSDGMHNSEQIAKLLSRPLNIVVQVLHDLEEIAAIEVRVSED